MSLKSELQEILYNYWATHRFCENGCQSVSDKDGEGTVEAIEALLSKCELEAEKRIKDAIPPRQILRHDINWAEGWNACRDKTLNQLTNREEK